MQDMVMKMRTIVVGRNDADQRLDKFMTKKFRNMPKALMYKYIRKKCVKLNFLKSRMLIITTLLKHL